MIRKKTCRPIAARSDRRVDLPHAPKPEPLKEAASDLAIFGGPKAFEVPLHVGQPNIVNLESVFERLEDIFQRAWLTNNGRYVQQFEAMIANSVGVRNCVATCNGTLALQLAIRALGMAGEVIVPSFTFIGTAHALAWQNIKPVFADIDPVSWTIDPESVRKLITPQTTGIVAVHLWGNPCHWEELQRIADQHHLKLLYDACHAFGCQTKGVSIGTLGDAEVFSFHATKFVHAAEGGAITTNDDVLAERLREIRNFGFSNAGVNLIGTNAKMTEVSAAIGISTLERVDEIVATNLRNRSEYETAFASIPNVGLKKLPPDATPNCQYVVVEVNDSCSLTSDELLTVLQSENVLARRYFHPGCHRLPAYRELYPDLVLPETDKAGRQALVLPTGMAIGVQEIQMIGSIIRSAIADAAAVRKTITATVSTSDFQPLVSPIDTPLATS